MDNNEVMNEVTPEEAVYQEEKVMLGPIPYDTENPSNKYLMISVNGVTIMLERGKKHEVPKRFADAYEHRLNMAGRKIRERERMARELLEKQNQEGVSFL